MRGDLDGGSKSENGKLNQRVLNSLNASFWIPRQRTFPNPNHSPAVAPQCPRYAHVALLVHRKFPLPERGVGFGLGCVSRTAVPETAVHKNREPRLPENKIRPHFEFPLSAFRFPLSAFRISICLRQPVILCRRNSFISASSVALFPRLRIRDITYERFALEKTSAIFQPQINTDGHRFIGRTCRAVV